METETKLHGAIDSNATNCLECKQNNNHSISCNHPNFQSSQHIKPTVKILHQALRILEERESKVEPTKILKEDIPGPFVNGDNSGTFAPLAENQCMSESRKEQARNGFLGYDLPTQNGFPYPTNPSWMQNVNVCKSCLGTTFPTNSQVESGCKACAGGTRFTSPNCSFQRGVPRVVRYFVEPASLNEIKCFPRRTKASTCCQRMNLEGPVMCAAEAMKQTSVDLQSRNLIQPLHGHTCKTDHCMSGDDHVLVCPAPWVHKGRLFPGVPAMCVDPQKYEVNWAPPKNECQLKPIKASSLQEMPDPIFPPGHHTSNFSTNVDMDTQRQLEEQIAHEILLLSKKLANLQARHGTKHVVHDNTKPPILSCPQTPLLLDNPTTQRDGDWSNASSPSMNEDCTQQRPATSLSSRSANHQQPNSRCQVEEQNFECKYFGPNTKGVPSITSSRRNDLRTAIALNGNHPNSRGFLGQKNNIRKATEAILVQKWGKALKETTQARKVNNFRTFTRKRREPMDVHSYSDDMKEHFIGGANVQGYPDGYKRFDWMKTLRFGGVSVCKNQRCVDFSSQMDSEPSSPREEFTNLDAETWLRDSSEHEVVPTSMSKSVQTGGINSSEGHEDACPIKVDDSKMKPKRRPDSAIGKSIFKIVESPKEMGGLDSRLAHHLVKAGLRRAPSFWRVPGIRPIPNANLKLKKKTFRSQSLRKDGGKHLLQKMLFDPNSNAPKVAQVAKVEEHVNQQCELEEESIDKATKCTMVGDYEAEYETFVENTLDVVQHNNNLECEEYTSIVNREALISQDDEQTKHKSSSNCYEKARLAKVPIVSLTKQPLHQATKKTFIRCIELVAATKKKNQVFFKLNGCKDSEYNSHTRIVDCLEQPSIGMERDRIHIIEGVA